MIRDLAGLASRPFDLVVIGGGIYGICAAREAARRGLAVCLLDRGDFVGETSSNSLRIIHGGLRYLQHADLGRMRASIEERRLLQRLAPALVRPLACVMPTYGHGLMGKEALRVALAMNDLVGFDRNAGLPPESRLPRGRVIDRRALLDIAPGVLREGLTGGAVWYDCQATSTERLAFAFLRSATDAGAACANHAEVTGFLQAGGRIAGVEVTDRLSGEGFEIRSRAVLNAAGPWVDAVLDRLPTPPPHQFIASKAFNVLVRRQLFPRHAVGLAGRRRFRDEHAIVQKGAQLFFVVPWRGCSMIGTRHLPCPVHGDDQITKTDVEAFLGEVNGAYPEARLSLDDVLAVYSGLLPEAGVTRGPSVQLLKHPTFRDHARDGHPGLFSVTGVKWTTARAVAGRTIDGIATASGWGPTGPGAELTALPGAASGERSPELAAYVARDPALGLPIAAGFSVAGADVLYGIREQMARRLGDVVFRRTELAADGHPGSAGLEACADLMAGELGWSAARRSAELELVEAVFHRRHSRPGSIRPPVLGVPRA
jgi:glycerol-3-phosphate dehydrogenase